MISPTAASPTTTSSSCTPGACVYALPRFPSLSSLVVLVLSVVVALWRFMAVLWWYPISTHRTSHALAWVQGCEANPLPYLRTRACLTLARSLPRLSHIHTRRVSRSRMIPPGILCTGWTLRSRSSARSSARWWRRHGRKVCACACIECVLVCLGECVTCFRGRMGAGERARLCAFGCVRECVRAWVRGCVRNYLLSFPSSAHTLRAPPTLATLVLTRKVTPELASALGTIQAWPFP